MRWDLADEQEMFRDSFADWLADHASSQAVRGWLDAGDAGPFWTRELRVPITLAFLIAFFNQLSGINAILYYLNDIFDRAGFSKVLVQDDLADVRTEKRFSAVNHFDRLQNIRGRRVLEHVTLRARLDDLQHYGLVRVH